MKKEVRHELLASRHWCKCRTGGCWVKGGGSIILGQYSPGLKNQSNISEIRCPEKIEA